MTSIKTGKMPQEELTRVRRAMLHSDLFRNVYSWMDPVERFEGLRNSLNRLDDYDDCKCEYCQNMFKEIQRRKGCE